VTHTLDHGLEVDPKHRATIAQIVRLREEEKLGWREISDRLEAQSAAEGRKPRPMCEREWDLSNARRCYARYQELLLRRKINDQWQRRREGSAHDPLAKSPAASPPRPQIQIQIDPRRV